MSFDPSEPTPEPPRSNENAPPVRARVPDHVADGCFSSGVIVMTGPSEFIVDFLQTVGRPHRVAKRVIVPHAVMPQFVDALQTNLQLYKNRFGDPPQPPTPNPPPEKRPTPQEIYDDLKLPDDVLSGVYANGVMIGHGASEFGLDFMTSFFPQSAVSARIFLAAGQIPRLLESLRGAVQQLQQRQQAIQGGGQIQVSAGGPQLPVQPQSADSTEHKIDPTEASPLPPGTEEAKDAESKQISANDSEPKRTNGPEAVGPNSNDSNATDSESTNPERGKQDPETPDADNSDLGNQDQ